MKVDLNDWMNQLTTLKTVKSAVMPKVFNEFKNQTPVKSGYAKRNTTFSNNTINAKYKYAEVLDAGRGYRDGQMRGSEQAPKGMSTPALEVMIKEVNNFVKNKGK